MMSSSINESLVLLHVICCYFCPHHLDIDTMTRTSKVIPHYVQVKEQIHTRIVLTVYFLFRTFVCGPPTNGH